MAGVSLGLLSWAGHKPNEGSHAPLLVKPRKGGGGSDDGCSGGGGGDGFITKVACAAAAAEAGVTTAGHQKAKKLE